MREPAFITFTGADDFTKVEDLKDLASEYPVEFGILFSQSMAGRNRYPGRPTVEHFRRSAPGLRLAAHLCGGYARDVAAGFAPKVGLAGFERVQVNIGSEPLHHHNICNVRRFGLRVHLPMIMQSRDCVMFPCDVNVSWLFDASGGRGILAQGWPKPPPEQPSVMVGYAGGLGPGADWSAIAEAAGDTPYWLDMETGVRDESDRFSIELCRKVCKEVYG